MRIFTMHRLEDATGISGTGPVAEVCQFSDGRCCLRWLALQNTVGVGSFVLYDHIHQLLAVHGHGGKTILVPEAVLICDACGWSFPAQQFEVDRCYQCVCENVPPAGKRSVVAEHGAQFSFPLTHATSCDPRCRSVTGLVNTGYCPVCKKLRS